jgi:hypothetical protein
MYLKSTIPSLINFQTRSFKYINLHWTQLCGPDGCVGMSSCVPEQDSSMALEACIQSDTLVLNTVGWAARRQRSRTFQRIQLPCWGTRWTEHLYQIKKKSVCKQLYVWRKLSSEVNTLEGYHFTSEFTSLHTCQLYRILSNKATVPPLNTLATYWIYPTVQSVTDNSNLS